VSGMKILVTGGSGRLGGYVLRELIQAGHQVASFGRHAPRVPDAEFIEGDILEPDGLAKACHGCDSIIHMAAVPHPLRATPARLRQINVIGTYQVLDAAVQAGAGQVVFASSGAAMGMAFQISGRLVPAYLPVDERHPDQPQDEYGLSKLLGEAICKRYSDAFGIRTICLRINSNWSLDWEGAEIAGRSGPLASDPRPATAIWESYRQQIEEPEGPFPVPGPTPPRDNLWVMTDARDAAQAFRLAAENETILYDMFYICADDTCSLVPSSELARRYFPGVPVRTPLEGFASLISHDKVTRLLGYHPRYSWRKSDFSEWLESRHHEPINPRPEASHK
jgi:UDP-glucose 4-epimerase